MKKEIAIDKMLEWVYCRELLKNPFLLPRGVGEGIYGPSAWHQITRLGKFGCKIDEGNNFGDWPWIDDEGPPHVDALTIDAAVRKLDQVTIVWDNNSLEYLSCPGLLGEDHLFVIAGEVRKYPSKLLPIYARLRKAPSWGDEWPRPYAVKNFGQVVVIPPKGRRKYPDDAFCPLTWEPKPETVALERVEYAAWYLGLMQLLDNNLVDKLTAHRPVAPHAPRFPWDGEQWSGPRKGRILPSLNVIGSTESVEAEAPPELLMA